MVPNGYKITNSMKTKTGHLAIVPFDEPSRQKTPHFSAQKL